MRAFAALLVLAVGLAVAPSAPANSLLQRGDRAPAFRFADVRTGTVYDFDSLAPDRPFLLVFLQTACRSCIREVIALKQLQRELDIPVVGVFLDVSDRDLTRYLRDYDVRFPFAWDPEGTTAAAYGVSATPTTFLVDRDRRIAAVYSGYVVGMEEEMRQDVERLPARP